MYPTTGYTPEMSELDKLENGFETARLVLLDQPGSAYWQSLLLDTYTRLAALDAQNEAGKAHQAMLDAVHPPHEVRPNHRHDVMGGDPESGIVFD